ncbi:carboxymuconolactone decarboxylase family protein [Citricoccus sp. GCM10030269]|uniref:carboxymuconolactone decarboxylase family protein n=1 Tax=Citricoccus sp. GCM10030269 TaxID=3273388 RepID=UPI0036239498
MVIRDAQHDVGLEQRRKMFGIEGAEDQVHHTTDLNDKLQDFVTRYCFGDIWQREGLSIPDRSKITIAMLIAQGNEQELRVHLRGALANGLTPLQLREIAVHAVLYCGIPASNEGLRALAEVLEEKGLPFEMDGEAQRTPRL